MCKGIQKKSAIKEKMFFVYHWGRAHDEVVVCVRGGWPHDKAFHSFSAGVRNKLPSS